MFGVPGRKLGEDLKQNLQHLSSFLFSLWLSSLLDIQRFYPWYWRASMHIWTSTWGQIAPSLGSPPLECSICKAMWCGGGGLVQELKLKSKQPVPVVYPLSQNTDLFGLFQSELYSWSFRVHWNETEANKKVCQPLGSRRWESLNLEDMT